MSESNLVNEWLSTYKTEDMKRTKRIRLERFLKWFGKSAEEFVKLSPKEAKKAILEFQAYELKRKTPNNSILSYISSAKGFYGYVNDIELHFTRGQLVKPQKARGYHEFSNGDLTSIFKIANTQYKALLSVAISGFSIGDILSLPRHLIKAKIQRAKEENQKFVFIELDRKKTNAPSLLVLNPLALEWLDKWLAIAPKGNMIEVVENGKAKQIETVWTVKENAVNRMLKRLAQRAIKNLEGEIKFHKIRAWTMRKLTNAGFNEFQIKYCVGKAIPLSDETYLRLRKEIEEKYPKIYDKYLNLLPATTFNQQREQKFQQLEQEVEKLKTLIGHFAETMLPHFAQDEGFQHWLESIKKLGIKPYEETEEQKRARREG